MVTLCSVVSTGRLVDLICRLRGPASGEFLVRHFSNRVTMLLHSDIQVPSSLTNLRLGAVGAGNFVDTVAGIELRAEIFGVYKH